MTIIGDFTMPSVCFIGNRRTGKTSIARTLLKKNLDYEPSKGVERHVYYSAEHKYYAIYDCAGDANMGGLGNHNETFDHFIIFTNEEIKNDSDLSSDEWEEKAHKLSPNATIHHVYNATIEKIEAILV